MSPTAAPTHTTRPFYFGPDEGLFGVLDLPVSESSERAAVVILQPLGHESTWCHRACRTLAARLADAGHTVLRFDYTGCGDSAGEASATDLAQWTADAHTAHEYMRARHPDVRVVGLRLGASLALLAQGAGADIEHLALWQPVVEGRAYLRELRALHAERARELGLDPVACATDGGEEVLGFVYSQNARRELEALDLGQSAAPGRARVLQLVNEPSDEQRVLTQRLKETAAALEERLVGEPSAWVAEPYKMVMPIASIDALLGWAGSDPR